MAETDLTPGRQQPSAVDKLDSTHVEKIGNDKAGNTINEEELDPVVTPKTWVVVAV